MKYVLGSIRFILLVLFNILVYIFFNLMLLFIRKTDQIGFTLRHFYFGIINPILGFRVIKELRTHEPPVLYVCNHRGLLDFFVTLRYLDVFILSKAEVKKIPILGKLAEYTGILFVDRENKNSRQAIRQAIVKNLKLGRNIFIFPEGTTQNNKTTADFYRGAFEEVAGHGFSVVPLVLEYKTASDFWKDCSASAMFFRQFGKWNTHCKLRIGPRLTESNPDLLLRRAREWMDANLQDMQKDWSTVNFTET